MIAPVSVIFPYYNEEKTLLITLEKISSQTLMPREVIFVNSSSTDSGPNIIDKWIEENQSQFETKFHNIFRNTNNPASSKNAGVDAATSEWITLMDCGLEFPNTWIESHWNFLQDKDIKFVSGQCYFAGETTIDACAIAHTYGYKRSRPTMPSSLIHRDVFNKVGKFIERRAGYDAVWPLEVRKAGYERGVNEDVQINYIGINFTPNLWHLYHKSILYSVPTVALRHYHIPYYFLLLFLIAIGVLFSGVIHPLILIGIYLVFKGYFIPLYKSRGLQLFKDYPFSIFMLPIVGFVMDLGRVTGIIKGIFVYHLGWMKP